MRVLWRLSLPLLGQHSDMRGDQGCGVQRRLVEVGAGVAVQIVEAL